MESPIAQERFPPPTSDIEANTSSCDSSDDCKKEPKMLSVGITRPDKTTTCRKQSVDEGYWRKMPVGFSKKSGSSCCVSVKDCCRRHYEVVQSHWFVLGVSLLIFAVLCGAGTAVCLIFTNAEENEVRNEALGLAQETGSWFSQQLDQAILPLFSLAQFATELEIFSDLPDKIGPPGEPGSLSFLPPRNGGSVTHRNVTGICDEPALVERFTEIASTIKQNAKMGGVLINLQLAPHGVVCLMHPLNNTEDFEEGVYMDNTGAFGLDLFTDPSMKAIAEASIVNDQVGTAGPLTLQQCKNESCPAAVEKAFIARLPIEDAAHEIVINGVAHPRWGFATALFSWEQLVSRSGIYETFANRGLDFQLTRTDRKYNVSSGLYYEEMVVLAETPKFHLCSRDQTVTTSLETTDNEWEITISYRYSSTRRNWVIAAVVLVSLCIAVLVFIVLLQKQMHSDLAGKALAQDAKVETERNMTAYFAHELRNPLGAIDSALSSFPDQMPEPEKDLISGMQLCTSFMSSIMNNLLDVRKMEEGKITLRTHPLSLSELLAGIHKMLSPSVISGVKFHVDCRIPRGQNWVLGDLHRIQQVFTNVVTNAIKYTLSGSITLALTWEGRFVKFECIDTGPGIPVEQQERLFERFVQRGGAQGTGLGLAIAKHIVDLMEGSIGFSSDPRIRPGTTCTVLLPLETCEEPEEQAARPQDIEPIQDPLSLLIVDDIKMNRLMLSRRFQKGVVPNCTITEAKTGEEALKICETEHFDVIIVDQYMEDAGGVMVGTDVVIAMRRMKIDSLIIGSSGNEVDAQFREAGADFVWQKPIPPNATIIQQLRGALEKRNTEKR